ncbi:MAG: hypothetical protein EOO50_01880 [Flavobacterium sp.]|uniref:hypothetical protein n=1 Tax=Flavobacterium sp. TaxID=239 RepID=UPI0012096646|nr:hypothetical protein [Flavobacterium sp.]RZJ68191.1 MAG: hypothetical protein EOO50_01880 [Flavobacterium sp.]
MKTLKMIIGAMLVLAIMWSCGDDDSSSGSKKLLSMNMQSDDVNYDNIYNFQYDDKGRLSQLNRVGATSYAMTFNYASGNKPSTVDITGDLEGTVSFTYDNKKRITSYSFDGQTAAITYTDAGFTISGQSCTLTSNGDLATFGTLAFSRDDSKKGPMADVKGYDALVLAILDGGSPFFYSKKALTALTSSSDPNTSLTVANIYSGNYPSLATISGGNDITITYQYSN